MCIRCSRCAWAWTRALLDELNHDQKKIMEHNAQQAQKEYYGIQYATTENFYQPPFLFA
jgi:hypothetical protein